MRAIYKTAWKKRPYAAGLPVLIDANYAARVCVRECACVRRMQSRRGAGAASPLSLESVQRLHSYRAISSETYGARKFFFTPLFLLAQESSGRIIFNLYSCYTCVMLHSHTYTLTHFGYAMIEYFNWIVVRSEIIFNVCDVDFISIYKVGLG